MVPDSQYHRSSFLILWFQIPNIAAVPFTGNVPQDDVGNFLGPFIPRQLRPSMPLLTPEVPVTVGVVEGRKWWCSP